MKILAINPGRGQYFARIHENISKPKDWKLGFTVLAGKMIGLFLALTAMMLMLKKL